MCRWMAWHGQSLLLDELLFKTKHGLIDQSLHSRLGVETTNGDGFGVGWYGAGEGPALYRSVAPAWGDANLRELAAHVESPLFLAHIRATTGTAIQETNCHPFRHGRWLFVHNGVVNDFAELRRDLVLAVDPSLFSSMVGSTDSEVVFHLALTFGLEDGPLPALERTIGFIEETARKRGIEPMLQTSMGVSDGTRVWAVRYSTERKSRSLFVSADVDALKRLHVENSQIDRIKPGDRVIISEPFGDLQGAWQEVEEGTALEVTPDGGLEHRDFTPVAA